VTGDRQDAKEEHGGVVRLFGGGEKGTGRKTWLDDGRCFLKEAAG
jgi:hypothetical protein